MRTTLDLDDALIKAAKQRAVREGITLTRLLELALRQFLRTKRSPTPGFRLELHTNPSPLIPGVDIDDRDALYERMEGQE